MASLNDLPTEVKLQILSYVNVDDITKCRQLSKTYNNLILSFPFNLQRVRCCVEAVFDSKQNLFLRIRKSGNSKIFEIKEENYEIIKSIEITNLQVNIFDENIFTDDSLNNDKAMEKLVKILIESKQQTMRIVTVKGLNLKNEVIANEFLNLELNLSGSIANYLSSKHVSQMQAVCQLRLDEFDNGQVEAANAIIAKFAYDMRHKPKINVPFIAEVNIADPALIFSLIQEWVCLPETPYFQIKFTNFNTEWLETFNDICDEQNVRHIFYEFSSKVNRHAHIKIKFHEESNQCMIFPVKDVPARNLVNQYICYARYCRDF
uniref:F-box domain-containing protein n=1 Tax=Panagrolaimus sp. ES5 TaxID=591445 RepID=A0AC34GPV6_9BILA